MVAIVASPGDLETSGDRARFSVEGSVEWVAPAIPVPLVARFDTGAFLRLEVECIADKGDAWFGPVAGMVSIPGLALFDSRRAPNGWRASPSGCAEPGSLPGLGPAIHLTAGTGGVSTLRAGAPCEALGPGEVRTWAVCRAPGARVGLRVSGVDARAAPAGGALAEVWADSVPVACALGNACARASDGAVLSVEQSVPAGWPLAARCAGRGESGALLRIRVEEPGGGVLGDSSVSLSRDWAELRGPTIMLSDPQPLRLSFTVAGGTAELDNLALEPVSSWCGAASGLGGDPLPLTATLRAVVDTQLGSNGLAWWLEALGSRALAHQRPAEAARTPVEVIWAPDVPPQGYELTIDESAAQVRASGPSGARHGVAALADVAALTPTGPALPRCTLQAAPRWPWRGAMVDLATESDAARTVQALAEARATDVLLAIPAASDIADPAALLAATVGPTGLEPVPVVRAWGQWLLRTHPQLAEAVPVRHETVRLTSLAPVTLSVPRVRLEAGARPRVASADGATTYSDGDDYALAAVPVALHSPRREPPPRTSLSRTAKGRIAARASVLVDYDTDPESVADAPACPADPAFTDAVWEEIRRGRGTLKTRYVAVEFGRTLQAGKDFRCQRAGKRTVDLILETTRDLALRARRWDDDLRLIVRAAEMFAGEPDDRRLARVPFNVVLVVAPGSPGAERLGRLGHAVLALDPHPGQTTEDAVSLAEALTANGANCLGVLGVLSYPRAPGLEGVIGRAAWLGSRAPTGER